MMVTQDEKAAIAKEFAPKVAKHTPGPWIHEGEGDITGIENNPAIGCVGKVDVACVYLRTVSGKTEANARLIAAAPELLEALKGMIKHFWIAGSEAEWDAIQKAKKTIAKAEGAQ